MPVDLREVLGYVPLTDAIKVTSSGIPNRFPQEFFTTTKDVMNDSARFREHYGNRKVAQYANYGSPARRFQLLDIGDKTVKLIHHFHEIPLHPRLWNALQQDESYEHDQALDQLKDQIFEFGQLFQNSRIAVLAQSLNAGIVYFDGNGDMLTSSSGAVYSISQGMNANNQNQLNGIVTASWALSSTDIPLQILNLKERSDRLTGLPVEMALYGKNIPSYLAINTYVTDWAVRDNRYRDVRLYKNMIPDGFLGIDKWTYIDAFWNDYSDTNQDIWGGDDITFCPMPGTGGWYQMFQGCFWVPTTFGPAADGVEAMKSMKPVHGIGSYADVRPNPPTVVHYGFDTFFPAFKNEDAVFQADTTP